jgi:hypothetical protein
MIRATYISISLSLACIFSAVYVLLAWVFGWPMAIVAPVFVVSGGFSLIGLCFGNMAGKEPK